MLTLMLVMILVSTLTLTFPDSFERWEQEEERAAICQWPS